MTLRVPYCTFPLVSQGEQTYTPRLIALDLPGSLKTLKQEGSLYDTHSGAKDSPAWYVTVHIHCTCTSLRLVSFSTNVDTVD